MRAKKLIKDSLAGLMYPYRAVKNRLTPGRNVRILMYHAVEEKPRSVDRLGLAVSPDVFRMQMGFLRTNGFTVIGLGDFLRRVEHNIPFAQRSVIITFDDGYRSVLKNAAPILKEFKYEATLFLSPSFIEAAADKGQYWNKWDALTWNEVLALPGMGINIGSHGLTHKKLAGVKGRALDLEVQRSKDIIEKELGLKVQAFSYPHGSFDNDVIKAIKAAGYRCACSSVEGVNGMDADLFNLKRTEISGVDTTGRKFARKVLGCYDWVGTVKGAHAKG